MSFFQTGYAWRPGTRLTADAGQVAKEIEAIASEDGINRADIIAAGLGGDGELSKCFTQDKDEAAMKRWQDEADYLMRCLIPVVVNPREEVEYTVNQRVWVPIYTSSYHHEDAGRYTRVPVLEAPPPTAMADPRAEAWDTLLSWRELYGNDPRYRPVVEAIDRLASEEQG